MQWLKQGIARALALRMSRSSKRGIYDPNV
jgi:hypothetical protein